MSRRHRDDPDRPAIRLEALRRVRQVGDPVLRARAARVEVFDAALQDEIERMGMLMDDAVGVGLAAPQIGLSRQLFVYRLEDDGPLEAVANPEILAHSDEVDEVDEGCLSISTVEVAITVERPVALHVRYQTRDGGAVERDVEGFEARVFGHETDHLHGKLILDRASKEDRRRALRALAGPVTA